MGDRGEVSIVLDDGAVPPPTLLHLSQRPTLRVSQETRAPRGMTIPLYVTYSASVDEPYTARSAYR